MRYRIAILGLAAVLGILPAMTVTPAAPAPKRTKMPEIYALIYVGLGKNDPGNAKRIDTETQFICNSGARGAVRDPKVNALPIVQDQENKHGWNERDRWAESKTRAASVEGTPVVRVWFTVGSPEEQVAIVNAIAREYVKEQQEFFGKALKRHEIEKMQFRAQQESAGVKVTKENERVFRRQEEMLKHPPHVLEWASLPEKP